MRNLTASDLIAFLYESFLLAWHLLVLFYHPIRGFNVFKGRPLFLVSSLFSFTPTRLFVVLRVPSDGGLVNQFSPLTYCCLIFLCVHPRIGPYSASGICLGNS